eukprot:TRINITY_DN1531_c1_g1_i1.p3 TRINITY_DN1531_c1_g1~~TRINITY_DN1531_c1_g1_i1.p3  ORF type:complete len:213 (-),score=28.65 TRINITY_DN1531_c1_g1_i1:815-1453(-)
MDQAGMVTWIDPASVRAKNGLFFRAKPDGTLRLIIDARAGNSWFELPPDPHLSNPADLGAIEDPGAIELDSSVPTHVLGKLDVTGYFHSFALPASLSPYFALPPVDGCSLRRACCTMPMGWSHAVYLAQSAHVHIMLRPSPSGEPSPLCEVTLLGRERRVRVAGTTVWVDNLGAGGGDARAVAAVLDEARRRLVEAGFTIKESEVQTPDPAG